MLETFIYLNDTLEIFVFYKCEKNEFCDSGVDHYLAIDNKMNLYLVYNGFGYWSQCPNNINRLK